MRVLCIATTSCILLVTPVGAETLNNADMDNLRQQLSRCWVVPYSPGIDPALLKVSIQFRLDSQGGLVGEPEVVAGGAASGYGRAAAESAKRAVKYCAPYRLPPEKYDAWAEIVVHFDPTALF